MTLEQAIGYTLLNTSAITALVSTRINHGNRPDGTVTPCINYFELSGGSRINGIESVTCTFNCRAEDDVTAKKISRLVGDLFGGTSSTGIYGTQNGFDFSRVSIKSLQGCIFESSEKIYNAPIDILFVYQSSTIS